jgi:hypothetical protein
MATTFVLTDTNSGLTSQGTVHNKKALDAAEGGTSLDITLAGGGTGSAAWYTEPSVPNLAQWPAGDYTVSCDIDATGADISYTLSLRRVNSAGTLQQTLGTSGTKIGTGPQSHTVAIGSPITTNAGDRLVGVLSASRAASHGNQTLTISVNGANDKLIGAWSAAANVTVTPTTAALVITAFAAIVTATENQVVTPTTKALSLTTFAPTVTSSDHKTVTPITAALSLTTFAPTVTGGAGQVVTPSTKALTLATFAPTVTSTAHQTVTPGVASLTLTAFAPTVTGGAGVTVTPSTAALTLETFAATVSATDHRTVTPGTAALTITTFAPTVTAGAGGAGFESRIVIGIPAGDIRLGDTLNIKFTTRNSSGLPSALTGGAIAAYPGNSVTEITAGITLAVDFDGRTGLNNVEVVASSANGYTNSTRYALVMTAGTVDGVSVAGYVIADFSVGGPTLTEVLNAKFLLQRKRVLDPATGIFTIYDADGTTPLFSAQTYKDVAGTQPYDGTGRIIRTEELA